jgi:hypothetical protein
MSQNRGQQRAYCCSPRWYVRVEPWWWWCRLGDNPWLVLQELSGSPTSRDIWDKSEEWTKEWEFCLLQYLIYLKGSLTCREILRHGTPGFTSHPKKGVLLIFIALKNPSLRLGLNPRPLGPVASTLTTTPPMRHGTTLRGGWEGLLHGARPSSVFCTVVHDYSDKSCKNS